jgi:DNA polymerase-3 subunit delta'
MKSGENQFDWQLVGNKHITDFLEKKIINGDLAGVYIFSGPDNLGKTTLAARFAQIMLCQEKTDKFPCEKCSSCRSFSRRENNDDADEFEFFGVHGDFHLIKKEKDKKNISVEQVRNFIRKLGLSSFLNSYKIGVIKNADTLSEEAANALLKTLEEPKERVVIILVVSDIDSLPETIVSRGQILRFNQASTGEIYDYLIKDHKIQRSAAKNFSRLALGRPALAIKFLEDKNFYNAYMERIGIFLDFLNQDINGRFKSIQDMAGSETENQEIIRAAKRAINVWQGLIRDLLLIEFNLSDLIQNEIIEKKLSGFKKKFKLDNLLNLADILRQSEKYLRANVNPRLALENIAISF